jgi:hypothetical protein
MKNPETLMLVTSTKDALMCMIFYLDAGFYMPYLDFIVINSDIIDLFTSADCSKIEWWMNNTIAENTDAYEFFIESGVYNGDFKSFKQTVMDLASGKIKL